METTNSNNTAVIFDSHRKEAIKKLKEKIANAVDEQKIFKENRKTVRFKGERKYEPWEAAMKADYRTHQLRILYAAYGLLRGRKITETENHVPKSWLKNYHPLMDYYFEIDYVLKEYGYQSAMKGSLLRNWDSDVNDYYSVVNDYYAEIVCIGE